MSARNISSLVKEIDALLPQTQCRECGYAGCLPYAEALAQGRAPIDKCPPGGVATVQALGELLHIDATPYLAAAAAATRAPAVAVIREADCIGCTKCIQACPVDAIIGARKLMHTVLPEMCTGCGLCVEPCPVDCIDMVVQAESLYDKDEARQRFHAREVRLLHKEHEKQQAYREKRRLAALTSDAEQDRAAKQAYVLQALARSQNKG